MKPVLQALVLAERVYTDITGKKIIAGTFHTIVFQPDRPLVREATRADGKKVHVLEAGAEGGSPYAYVSLTDVVDGTELALQFVDVSKNQVLFGNRLKLQCKDRLATIEVALSLPTLYRFISEPGVFSFDVVWEGEILGSHRILAIQQTEG